MSREAEFAPGKSRDPVGLLLAQAKLRVPVRHGRMLVCPFTLYREQHCRWRRIWPQLPHQGFGCSCAGMRTCPISGAFASPERRLVFDINDFGETLPGPFEWDVKRLAASLAVAGRDNGFTAETRRKIVPAAAEGYRTAMRAFTRQPRLDVWYAHLDIERASASSRPRPRRKRFKAAQGPPPRRRRAGEDRTTA